MKKINLNNEGHGILNKGVESLMRRKRRRDYIQTPQGRLLYITMGVVAVVVVGGILIYSYVLQPGMEREVVRPVEQEAPVRMAAQEPARTEEPEVEPAAVPEVPEEMKLEVPEEELAALTTDVSEPLAEGEGAAVGPAVEEEATPTAVEIAEEPPVTEEVAALEEQVVEVGEEPVPSSVVEEQVVSGVEPDEEEVLEAVPPEEELVQEVEPEEELVAARAIEPGGVAGEPEVVLPAPEAPEEAVAVETPTPPEEGAVEPKELRYALHVASYKSEEQAIKDATGWVERGREALSVLFTVPGEGLWYRVLVGRYATNKEASNQGARLREEEGLEYAAPMALPFVIEVSTFQTLTVAGFEEAKLRDRGYTTFIYPVKGEEGAVRYKLCVGVFDEEEEAAAASQRMNEEGLSGKVLLP